MDSTNRIMNFVAMLTIDYTGIALIIGAISAAVGPIVTALLQWRASKIHDKDKSEAIAARNEQNQQIEKVHGIVSAVAPAVLAKTGEHSIVEPSPVEQPVDPEKAGGV